MRKRQKLSSVNQLQGKDSPSGLIVPAPVLKALGMVGPRSQAFLLASDGEYRNAQRHPRPANSHMWTMM